MSFDITSTTGLRATGLSIADSVFSAGCGLGIWVKCGNIYVRGLNLYSDADGSAPYARLGVSGSPDHVPIATFRSGTDNTADSASQFSTNTWTLIWANWDSATGDITVGAGTTVGNTVAGPSDWLTWTANPIKSIAVGLQRAQDGSGDEFATGSCGLAMPFIVKRKITGTDLTALVAGDHPADVFDTDLYDYWALDSKTSALNSIALSDVGGTVNINSGDNPSVNDPTGGATLVRPTSDVTTTGWSTSTGSNFYALVDETNADDADYVISPTITASTNPITWGLGSTIAAGTYTVRVRAKTTTGTARMRVFLLDSSNVQQGVSTYQTLSTSFTTYSFAVTTSGSASRLRIETVVV